MKHKAVICAMRAGSWKDHRDDAMRKARMFDDKSQRRFFVEHARMASSRLVSWLREAREELEA